MCTLRTDVVETGAGWYSSRVWHAIHTAQYSTYVVTYDCCRAPSTPLVVVRSPQVVSGTAVAGLFLPATQTASGVQYTHSVQYTYSVQYTSQFRQTAPPTHLLTAVCQRRPAMPRSRECDLHSPIWDCSVDAVEVFYASDNSHTPQDSLIHALIVRSPSTAKAWRCDTRLALPGTGESCPTYTTEEIRKLISNPPLALADGCAGRASSRRAAADATRCAAVYSVRVSYNGRRLFLDRDERDWHSWSQPDLVFSTMQVQDVLALT
jgi:hypothetical protein